MTKIPCFIISFNRLTFLKRQLECLVKHPKLDIVIIDNNSTYKPLLKFYSENDFNIRTMDKNYGHEVVWSQGLSKEIAKENTYIVTDCDILTDRCAHDYIEVLEYALNVYPHINKVGLGLNTNKIPHNYPKRDEVIKHETKFIHRKEIGSEVYYECPVDTTFAMYRGGYHKYSVWGTDTNVWEGVCRSLRTKKPYECTHLGWHITNPTEEDKFYFESIKDQKSGSWRI